MYTLEQLKTLELAELLKIASEMGINNADKLSHDDLGYSILDHQADSAAAKENEKTTRKRTRVSVKNVDRVYTASKEKAKKVDKKMQVAIDDTLFGALSKEEKDMLTPNGDAPSEQPAPQATAEAPASKKRGRKKKEETPAEKKNEKTTAEKKKEEAPVEKKKEKTPAEKKKEETSAESKEESPAPKKRGRKKKDDKAEPVLEPAAEVTEKETPATEKQPASNPIQKTFIPEEMSGVPEADESNSSRYHQVITLGSAQPEKFVAPSDGTDFIVIKDVESSANILRELNIDYEPLMMPKEENYTDTPDGLPVYEEEVSQKKNKQSNQKANSEKEPIFDFGDSVVVIGVLETQENYGFIRSSDYNYLPSPDDVYVTLQQIKHWGLKNGDVVEGHIRPPREGERWFILTDVLKINGCDPQKVRDRIAFEFLTPLFPDEKFKLCKGYDDSKSSRIVDLFSPIGKGQRALIVAQPKTGKTLLMKDIANSISRNHPEAYLMMLLIDERPEEVTDMARTVNAEVIASTFDAPAENHVKIAGIVLEKAKRMVECGHDVVIFLDSITRLARAYNTVSPASGKVLSGGVDANALHKPKRFFGAARNIEGGGSLTIIATALIDTGSKMDEVIFEEFKGTGNMELQLDRQLANKRVFPAVNLIASSTRRDDLLQDQTTLNRMWVLRKHIADMTSLEAMDTVMNYIDKTKNNEEFLLSMNG